MAIALIPDSRFRPQTAMAGETDVRDDLIYGAIVVGGGASGTGKLFTVPQGQAIPQMKSSSYTATAQAHQMVHSELTTNLEKAGEFGSGLGDAAVRGISLCLETATISSAGAYGTFGAQPLDVAEFLAKTFFQFKVGQKVMTQGPSLSFPAWGGVNSSCSTTANAAMNGFALNGNALLGGRRIRIPIQIGRTDIVVGVLGFGNSASLTGSAGATYGSPFLVWCLLNVLLGADVR
jgi:hypothetical protein